jgi:thioredoxin 1
MVAIPDVKDGTFDKQVLEAGAPVLVDFGAEWCHPCIQLDPIVEQLAEEWDGRLKVVKMDIDENVDTTIRFGVMGVPTLLLFVDGEPVERMVGFVPREKIIQTLEPYLNS